MEKGDDLCCNYGLCYQLLSHMWNFVFAESAILASGASIHEHSHHWAADVKWHQTFLPNVGESRLRHLLFLSVDRCHTDIKDTKLSYVPCIAGHSYFSQGILLSKGTEFYNNVYSANWCQYLCNGGGSYEYVVSCSRASFFTAPLFLNFKHLKNSNGKTALQIDSDSTH